MTERQEETIAGRVTGGALAGLELYLNGTRQEMTAPGGAFQAAISLRPGQNRVRVVARDGSGAQTEDSVTIEYAPPPPSARITIKTPPDGHTLSRDDPPFVVVAGRVEDPAVSMIGLVVNEVRVLVPARQGHFHYVLPITEPVVHLWAETVPDGPASRRSPTVTVRASSPASTVGAILIDWPAETRGVHAEVRATWRANPARLDGPVPPTTALAAFGDAADGAPPRVFYLRNLRAGVYTFWLHYRVGAGATDVKPALLLTDSGSSSIRKLRPLPVNGTGRAVLARILLPQGILWEQDEWFTGQSQSADTLTKFRLPDGVTWAERKTDLR